MDESKQRSTCLNEKSNMKERVKQTLMLDVIFSFICIHKAEHEAAAGVTSHRR